MKKLFCFLLCALMALSLCPLSLAAETPTIPKVVLSDTDFSHTISTNSSNQRTFNFNSGLIAPEYGGVIETVTLPGEEDRRGTSLKIGLEQQSASLPSLNVPITSLYGSSDDGELTLDYDLYINEIKEMVTGEMKASTVRFGFYGANSDVLLYWSKRTDGRNLRAYANGASGYGQFYEFAEKQWYKLRLELAWTKANGTYSYTYNMYYAPYEDGSDVCEEDAFTQILANASVSTTKQITQLRIYCPRLAAAATWFAIDNVTVKQPVPPPDIAGLGYETEDGITCAVETGGNIPHTAQKLAVRLTDSVYRVNNGDVLVKVNGRELAVSETTYDEESKSIWLTLAEPLEEPAAGQVVLTEAVEVSEGVYLPVVRTAGFTVPEAKLQLSLLADGDFAVAEETSTDSAGHYLVLENGMTAYDGAGYASVSTTVPESDGPCLVVGLDEVDPDRPTSLPRAIIDLPDLSSYGAENLTLDFKIYISQKTHNGDGNNFRLMLYGNSATPALTLGSTVKAGTANQGYTAASWHSVRLKVRWTATGQDTYQYTYDVYWDGQLLAEQAAAPAALTKLTALRFYAPYYEPYTAYMALDDISLQTEKKRPDILGFGFGGNLCEDGFIDYRTNIAEVYLTNSVESVSADQVQLSWSGIPVTLTGVGLDMSGRRLLLRTAESFLPNTTYEVVLGEDIAVMQGTPLGRTRTGSFITTTEAVNITDVTITEAADSIQITAKAKNTQTEEQTACLLGGLWRGKQFLGVRAVTCRLAAGEEKPLSLEIADLAAGDRVELSGWDSLAGVKLFTRGVTVYAKP